MREPHPQGLASIGWCGHVTNKKRYISTFTRSMAPKRSKEVTQDEGTPPTKSLDTLIAWSRDK